MHDAAISLEFKIFRSRAAGASIPTPSPARARGSPPRPPPAACSTPSTCRSTVAPCAASRAVRPPGHHAIRDSAMGFCIFGNVALAAHYARRTHRADRVLIVDWDVHHGNGTQALVEHDPGIHFVSMHQWPWYPGTGAASERGIGNLWNVPLPGGAAARALRERAARSDRRGDRGLHSGSRADLRRLRLARG